MFLTKIVCKNLEAKIKNNNFVITINNKQTLKELRYENY